MTDLEHPMPDETPRSGLSQGTVTELVHGRAEALAEVERLRREEALTAEHLRRQAAALDLAKAQKRKADAEVERLRAERDQAIAHDRQPYPTADAYEKVCAALREHKAEVERLREALSAAKTEATAQAEKATGLADALAVEREAVAYWMARADA